MLKLLAINGNLGLGPTIGTQVIRRPCGVEKGFFDPRSDTESVSDGILSKLGGSGDSGTAGQRDSGTAGQRDSGIPG